MLSIYKELIQDRIDKITSFLNKISEEVKIDKKFTNRGTIWSSLNSIGVNTAAILDILSAEEGKDNEH